MCVLHDCVRHRTVGTDGGCLPTHCRETVLWSGQEDLCDVTIRDTSEAKFHASTLNMTTVQVSSTQLFAPYNNVTCWPTKHRKLQWHLKVRASISYLGSTSFQSPTCPGNEIICTYRLWPQMHNVSHSISNLTIKPTTIVIHLNVDYRTFWANVKVPLF